MATDRSMRLAPWTLVAMALLIAGLALMAIKLVTSRAGESSAREPVKIRHTDLLVGRGDATSPVEIIRAELERNALTQEETKGLLEGAVVDDAGASVEHAAVALFWDDRRPCRIEDLVASGLVALTDEQGAFRIPGAGESHQPTGTVVVRHPGYMATSQEVAVPGSATIVVRRGLKIAGRVLCGLDRVPVAGVTVAARGVGAIAQCGRSDVFAPPRARVQTAVSGRDGAFIIDGCEPGWYQVDVVAKGLTSFFYRPPRQESAVLGTQWVRAGQESVDLVVLALAVARVQLVDASSGAMIGLAEGEVTVTAPDAFSSIYPCPSFVANGMAYGPRAEDAHSLHAFLAREWPVREGRARLRVRVGGYEEHDGEVSLNPVGADSAADLVRLTPIEDTGVCVCELRDRNGHPVGPVALFVGLSRSGAAFGSFRFLVDERGRSAPVALPSGEYAVEPLHPKVLGPVKAGAAFRVDAGRQTIARLELEGAGLRVEVMDSGGVSLDGYGLRVGPGHGAVAVRRYRDPQTNAMVTTGMTYPAPGHGRVAGDIRFLRDADGGPITVEVFRHGYEPVRAFGVLVPGEVASIPITLVEDPDGEWQPKVEWSGGEGIR